MAAGDELGAEADAEHRLVGLAEGARQRGNRGEPGAPVIVEGVLRPAEDDERIVIPVIDRYRLAEKGAPQIDPGAGLGKRDTDEAGRGGGEIFDDQNAQGEDDPRATTAPAIG